MVLWSVSGEQDANENGRYKSIQGSSFHIVSTSLWQFSALMEAHIDFKASINADVSIGNRSGLSEFEAIKGSCVSESHAFIVLSVWLDRPAGVFILHIQLKEVESKASVTQQLNLVFGVSRSCSYRGGKRPRILFLYSKLWSHISR